MRALTILALLVASVGAWGDTHRTCCTPDPAPLPEPGTLTLMAAGALAAFKLRRKK